MITVWAALRDGSGVGGLAGTPTAGTSNAGLADDLRDVVGAVRQIDGAGDLSRGVAVLGRVDDGVFEDLGRVAVGRGCLSEFGLHVVVHLPRFSRARYHNLMINRVDCPRTDKVDSHRIYEMRAPEGGLFSVPERRQAQLRT